MTQKIRILAMVFLALAMAWIGGAVTAHAEPTPASLEWSPTTSSGTYDYGTLATGATKSVTFTLTNSGGKATGPLTSTLSGSSAFTITQDGCTGRSLGPKKPCTVSVQYAPTSSGERGSATLLASGKVASASLTLTGQTGVSDTPNLTLSPGRFNGTRNDTKIYDYLFPNTGAGSSVTTTFTVTNSSTDTSQALYISCGNSLLCPDQNDHPFALNNDTCTNRVLLANESCTFDLEFTAPASCSVPPPDLEVEINFAYITLFAETRCA